MHTVAYTRAYKNGIHKAQARLPIPLKVLFVQAEGQIAEVGHQLMKSMVGNMPVVERIHTRLYLNKANALATIG
jgi:hypothetical protein